MKKKIFSSLIIGSVVLVTLAGQTGRPTFTDERTNSRQDQQENRPLDPPDTTTIYRFTAVAPLFKTALSDTALSRYVHQYDPARRRAFDYAHLGVPGSAARAIVYEPSFRKGLDIGLHQYDLYYTTVQNFQFYQLERAYTNLFYSQQGEQADGTLKAQFSRNFAGGTNFSLDYTRLNHSGAQFQFPNQNRRNTALALGIWQHHNNGKYDGFFTVSSNTIEQADNGGVAVLPDPNEDFSNPGAATVVRTSANTRIAHREYAYTHYFKLGGITDTLKAKVTRAYTFGHQILFNHSRYKYADPITTLAEADSSYYGAFLNHRNGIRFYLDHQKVENTFSISTYKQSEKQKNRKDLVEIGLWHTLHTIDQGMGKKTYNDLFLMGKIQFRPGKSLLLNTYGHLALLNNAGDYRLTGDLQIEAGAIGRLSVQAISQLYSPTLLQRQFVVSNQEMWNNDLKKTLENSLSATIAIPGIDLQVAGSYHLLNNYIYFDSLAYPTQIGKPANILQLTVEKNLRLGPIHLDNLFALQESALQELPLPPFFGKHSLYYLGKWFKVLEVRTGVDIRYQAAYKAPYYHALTGQFILQNDNIPLYPAVDLFFSLRVTRFRAFAKWEDAYTFINNQEAFYLLSKYPLPRGGFRIGIWWRLSD